MAINLQKVLQAPLLLSLATCYPEGFSSSRGGDRRDKRDIPELAKNLERAVRDAGLDVDLKNFTNRMEWARKKLVTDCLLSGQPGISWEITDRGVTHLRQIVMRVLRELPAARLDAFWREDGPDGFKRWVVVFDRVPKDEVCGILFQEVPKSEIYDSVRCGRGDATARLWSAMFDTLPNDQTIDLLLHMYEDLLKLFLEFHRLIISDAS